MADLAERVAKLEQRAEHHDDQMAEVRKDVRDLQSTVWKAVGAMTALMFVIQYVVKLFV